MRGLVLLVLSTAALLAHVAPSIKIRAAVEVVRVPNGGIQPEIAVGNAGVAHMVYLAGEPGGLIHKWEIGACPMTSMSIVGGSRPLRAWETDGQVYFLTGNSAQPKSPPATNGAPLRRKHPRMAVNKDGVLLLAWTEGTSWGRGGSIAWHVFDGDGRPIGSAGSAQALPVWSFPAVLAKPDGTFSILY